MSRCEKIERNIRGNDGEKSSMLNTLYQKWIEDDPVYNEDVRNINEKIEACIGHLEITQIDQIDDLVADLCVAYSRAGYLAGARAGARLILELFEDE